MSLGSRRSFVKTTHQHPSTYLVRSLYDHSTSSCNLLFFLSPLLYLLYSAANACPAIVRIYRTAPHIRARLQRCSGLVVSTRLIITSH